MRDPATPSLAAVVPAHQAAAEVGRCLDALLAAGFAAAEIVVVDDGSRDGTGDVARARGVRVLRNEAPQRPARARNRGVDAVAADVVLFVDADVTVRADARDRVLAFFRDHPGHAAMIGSYDDRPAAPRPVSRYRNLLHHWVHQHAPPEAETFWTGLGAVRRDAFLAAGGLDPDWENIEDVELGLRLRAMGGRIGLDRDLQGTHLKDWTLRAMWRTDWKGRALPWARLVRLGRARMGGLNTARAHQASALLVVAALLLLPLGLLQPWAGAGAAACAGGFVLVNRRFLRFLAARGGWGFAARAALWHAVHYLAAVMGYAEARLRPLPAPRPSLPASK